MSLNHEHHPGATSELSCLEQRLGCAFRDPTLLGRALTHKSYAYEAGGDTSSHNEPLEFLGDAILGFLVTDFIYRAFPTVPEGRLSKIKAHLVSSVTLAALAQQLDLPAHLRLGKGEEKTGGRKKRALSANAFEAVVAAIYLDSGMEPVRSLLKRLYAPIVEDIREGRAAVEDPKTALQEHLQARNLPPAQYLVTWESGPEHRKTFHVELVIGERTMAAATGSTKKKAQAETALAALLQLRHEEGGGGK